MVEFRISIVLQYFMYIFARLKYLFKVLKTDFTIIFLYRVRTLENTMTDESNSMKIATKRHQHKLKHPTNNFWPACLTILPLVTNFSGTSVAETLHVRDTRGTLLSYWPSCGCSASKTRDRMSSRSNAFAFRSIINIVAVPHEDGKGHLLNFASAPKRQMACRWWPAQACSLCTKSRSGLLTSLYTATTTCNPSNEIHFWLMVLLRSTLCSRQLTSVSIWCSKHHASKTQISAIAAKLRWRTWFSAVNSQGILYVSLLDRRGRLSRAKLAILRRTYQWLQAAKRARLPIALGCFVMEYESRSNQPKNQVEENFAADRQTYTVLGQWSDLRLIQTASRNQ